MDIQSICAFELSLRENEKSEKTVEKYIRDVKKFFRFAGDREFSRSLVAEYKASLLDGYAVTSANSMIAAVNAYLCFAGQRELCVKQFKVQKKVYSSEDQELTREEYCRLVNAAKNRENRRLSLVLQTVCATGIRVSELEYITVEAARKGRALVNCKGKTRTVFILQKLCKKLLKYAKERRIVSGAVFVTKNGRPMNRSNIWREMKSLCHEACVSEKKVFPHNLRHLFARTFYGIEKDIAALADILGHSSINTTRIYIVTTGAEHRRKMENMRLVM